jgi:hypothetical protein
LQPPLLATLVELGQLAMVKLRVGLEQQVEAELLALGLQQLWLQLALVHPSYLPLLVLELA